MASEAVREDVKKVREEIAAHKKDCERCAQTAWCQPLYELMRRLQQAAPSQRWSELMKEY